MGALEKASAIRFFLPARHTVEKFPYWRSFSFNLCNRGVSTSFSVFLSIMDSKGLWSTIILKFFMPKRYTLHFPRAHTTASISSSTIEYLLSVSLMKRDPQQTIFHYSPCFYIKTNPRPCVLEASVWSSVSRAGSKLMSILGLERWSFVFSKAYSWSAVHWNTLLVFSSPLSGYTKALNSFVNYPN